MRKAQKTVKRQIKINEKKEIKFIEKPTESELDALSLKDTFAFIGNCNW